MTREEKAVGREVFYTLCLRFFLSQLSKGDRRAEGLSIFLRPKLKAGPYNVNGSIQASGLPLSLLRAKITLGAVPLSWFRH